MNIRENIETMLGAIASGDNESAQTIFSDIITQKAAERLDAYKADVANQYFNGVKESDEIDEENV
jgi:hypothetical protein